MGIFDRRNGQGNYDQAAILALPNRLKMVDALTSSDARENFALFALPILRNYNCNGLADRLGGREAKDVLGALVPACNNAIEVLAYNRVITGLDYRGHEAQPLFTFVKRSF